MITRPGCGLCAFLPWLCPSLSRISRRGGSVGVTGSSSYPPAPRALSDTPAPVVTSGFIFSVKMELRRTLPSLFPSVWDLQAGFPERCLRRALSSGLGSRLPCPCSSRSPGSDGPWGKARPCEKDAVCGTPGAPSTPAGRGQQGRTEADTPGEGARHPAGLE